MTTTTDALIQTIREATGETEGEARGRIAQSANTLGFSAVCTVHPSGECLDCGSPMAWYDEDADEIAAPHRIRRADDDSDLYA